MSRTQSPMRQTPKRLVFNDLQRRALVRAIKGAIRAAKTYKVIAEEAVASLERVALVAETDAERGGAVN